MQVDPAWVALLTPLDQQLTNPYVSGDTVYLRTSGLGATAPGDITIVAGGIDAAVISREPDPSQQGFDRIGFRMPDDAAETCYLPLYLRTATGETTSIYVPKVNQPGPCRHPWNLDAAAMTTLDNGGRIWVGQPALSVYERESVVQGSAIFQQVERWRMAQLAAPEDSRACRVMPPNPIVVPPDVMRSTLGDAGPELGLLSSQSELQTFQLQQATLTYTARFSQARPYAGEWTLKVPGGRDIGAFETRVDLPDPPAWTAPERIDRSADLMLTWNTGGLTSLDRLTIAAGSGLGPFIECRTTGEAGTLTIPARYLRRLPASPQGLISMVLSRPFERRALFSMPLANGNAAVGVFDYRVVSTVTDVPIE